MKNTDCTGKNKFIHKEADSPEAKEIGVIKYNNILGGAISGCHKNHRRGF